MQLAWHGKMIQHNGLVDLSGFNAMLNRLQRGYPGASRDFLRKAFIEVIRRVVKRTPVDSGQARAGWMPAGEKYGVRASVLDAGENPDSEKQADGYAEGELNEKLKGHQMYIEAVNNVPHIVALEYGHSEQAPQGMVRITLHEIGQAFGYDLSDTLGEMA